MVTRHDPEQAKWAEEHLEQLKLLWASRESQAARYSDVLERVERERVWEWFPPGTPYQTPERMLRAVGVGDRKALRRLNLSQRAQEVEPARPRGRPPVPDDEFADEGVPREKAAGGTSSDALLARIRRDHPDVYQRVLDGEFETAAEAARAAGIGFVKNRPKAAASARTRSTSRRPWHGRPSAQGINRTT